MGSDDPNDGAADFFVGFDCSCKNRTMSKSELLSPSSVPVDVCCKKLPHSVLSPLMLLALLLRMLLLLLLSLSSYSRSAVMISNRSISLLRLLRLDSSSLLKSISFKGVGSHMFSVSVLVWFGCVCLWDKNCGLCCVGLLGCLALLLLLRLLVSVCPGLSIFMGGEGRGKHTFFVGTWKPRNRRILADVQILGKGFAPHKYVGTVLYCTALYCTVLYLHLA